MNPPMRHSSTAWTVFSISLIVGGSLLLLPVLAIVAMAMTPEPTTTNAPGTLTPIVMYARLSPVAWLTPTGVGLCALVAIASGIRGLARRRAKGEFE
jgi:hypothetical protein